MAEMAMRYTGTRDESNRDYEEFLDDVKFLLELGQSDAKDESFTRWKKESEIYKAQNFIRYGDFNLDLDAFNACVQTLNNDADTVLHLAVSACDCAEDSETAYKETIDSVVIFILLNRDILNTRDRVGKTALMMAAENGCLHIVRVLVDWTEHDGVKVELNAEDIYGETALFKAALRSRVKVVKFLAQRGALDICDNQGFSALHAAVCGPRDNIFESLFSDFFGDFCSLTFMDYLYKLSTETCRIYEMFLKEFESKTRNSGNTVKIINILLQNYPGSITTKDFRGKTALDWAIRSKTRISELTISKLNQMTQTKRKTSIDELLGIDELGRTSFHRISAILPIYEIRIPGYLIAIIHRASYFHETNFKFFKTMACRKDSRGRSALHYAAMTDGVNNEQTGIFETILQFGCNVNETDAYGRTPLHYATNDVYELLEELGANETVKDIDGKTPLDLTTLRQKEDTDPEDDGWMLGLGKSENIENIWEIWKTRKYAFFEPISESLVQCMKCFFDRLAEEIGKKDPRFECRPVMVGSAYEETRIGFMDEFDFDLVLTKFSECCDVCPAPEAPVGFVRLQRKLITTENGATGKGSQKKLNFDEFFNNNGVLLSNKVASRFRCLYSEVMKQPIFWASEPYFEWDLRSEFSKFSYDSGVKIRSFSLSDLGAARNLCTNIILRLNRPINGQYMFREISVDIVPCIRVAGWWPDGILTSISGDLSSEGCYLVFDQPQKKYPWVPYSTDPYVRISFAEAESRIVKKSSVLARAAYMVVKRMFRDDSRFKFTHIWKNSLLYCVEAMKDDMHRNMTYEQISREDLRLFVGKLFLCFLEFYRQDFCPCYMMPSFSLPIGRELKSHHRETSGGYDYQEAYMLYRRVCKGTPEMPYREPAFQPLFENFDRDELMRKLSNIPSSESIIVQPSESSEPNMGLKRTIPLELPESKRQKRDSSIAGV